jgi:hypothetical protein
VDRISSLPFRTSDRYRFSQKAIMAGDTSTPATNPSVMAPAMRPNKCPPPKPTSSTRSPDLKSVSEKFSGAAFPGCPGRLAHRSPRGKSLPHQTFQTRSKARLFKATSFKAEFLLFHTRGRRNRPRMPDG